MTGSGGGGGGGMGGPSTFKISNGTAGGKGGSGIVLIAYPE